MKGLQDDPEGYCPRPAINRELFLIR